MSVALLRNDLKKAHASGKKSKEQALGTLAQAGSAKYQKKSDVTKSSTDEMKKYSGSDEHKKNSGTGSDEQKKNSGSDG